jgi:hypothetical protein
MWLVRQVLQPKLESEKSRKSLYTFRGHFGKDIYVSPFMPSTGGGYTIDTCDPCASSSNQLDILVTLTKAEGGPLLVTRVRFEFTRLRRFGSVYVGEIGFPCALVLCAYHHCHDISNPLSSGENIFESSSSLD